jgi:putative NADPH-quinone reductase
MKNVLIIFGGPSQKGFNWELYQELIRFMTASSFSVEQIDLYREDFDPVIRETESDINNRMISNYQEMIKKADLVIMISPVWWSRCTTMLEGFFDKILSYGFAFQTEPKWEPLLSNKKVITFLTLGNKSRWRQRLYYLITFLRLKFGVLKDCFSMNTKIKFFSVTKSTTVNDKAFLLEKARDIIRGNI